MIYAISGPPRCGKSTLERAVHRHESMAQLSTDVLWAATQALIPADQWPQRLPLAHLRQARLQDPAQFLADDDAVTAHIQAHEQEAQTVWPAIAKSLEFFVRRHESVVVEGSLLRPSLLQPWAREFGAELRGVVLTRWDVPTTTRAIHDYRTDPDWLIDGLHEPDQLTRAARLIVTLGRGIATEARLVGWPVLGLDDDFHRTLTDAETILCGAAE